MKKLFSIFAVASIMLSLNTACTSDSVSEELQVQQQAEELFTVDRREIERPGDQGKTTTSKTN